MPKSICLWPPVADVSDKRSLDCMLIKLAIHSLVKVDEYQSIFSRFFILVLFTV